MTKNFTIDVAGKKLGRSASDIAAILIGKKSSDFQKNQIADVKVDVINAAQLDITEKKARTTKYTNYSGFPGGLRTRSLEEVAAKRGYSEVLRIAVAGMIHRNKLKDKILKNLTIKD